MALRALLEGWVPLAGELDGLGWRAGSAGLSTGVALGERLRGFCWRPLRALLEGWGCLSGELGRLCWRDGSAGLNIGVAFGEGLRGFGWEAWLLGVRGGVELALQQLIIGLGNLGGFDGERGRLLLRG